jgi:hypothetical protein
MLKRVDVEETPVTGYSFKNKNGNLEFVKILPGQDVMVIVDSGQQEASVWKSDIPLLIKALQAAYEHKEV